MSNLFNDAFDIIKIYPILDERWSCRECPFPCFTGHLKDFPPLLGKDGDEHEQIYEFDGILDCWGRPFPENSWEYVAVGDVAIYDVLDTLPYYENVSSTVCGEQVSFKLYDSD